MCSGLCKISAVLALGGFLAASASEARAQTSGRAVYGGSPDAVTLSVNVTASVSASCTFSAGAAPGGTYSLGNVEGAYSLDVTFSLRCNSPSRVGIVSDNGGMKAADVPSVPPGYSRLAPYQITLSLAGDAGNHGPGDLPVADADRRRRRLRLPRARPRQRPACACPGPRRTPRDRSSGSAARAIPSRRS